jgi:hypothetical protein
MSGDRKSAKITAGGKAGDGKWNSTQLAMPPPGEQPKSAGSATKRADADDGDALGVSHAADADAAEAAEPEFRVRVRCEMCMTTVEAPSKHLLTFATCGCDNRVMIAQENVSHESVLMTAQNTNMATVVLSHRIARLPAVAINLERWNALQKQFKATTIQHTTPTPPQTTPTPSPSPSPSLPPRFTSAHS